MMAVLVTFLAPGKSAFLTTDFLGSLIPSSKLGGCK